MTALLSYFPYFQKKTSARNFWANRSEISTRFRHVVRAGREMETESSEMYEAAFLQGRKMRRKLCNPG